MNLNFKFKSLRSEIIFALAKLIDVPFGKNAIFDYIDSMLKIFFKKRNVYEKMKILVNTYGE